MGMLKGRAVILIDGSGDGDEPQGVDLYDTAAEVAILEDLTESALIFAIDTETLYQVQGGVPVELVNATVVDIATLTPSTQGVIQSGAAFPLTGEVGQLFFQNAGEVSIGIWDGEAWITVAYL